MLNILVSDTLLRHSIHSESLFSTHLTVWFIICIIISFIISFIWIAKTDGTFVTGMLPPSVVMMIFIGLMIILGANGERYTGSKDSNSEYQHQMLRNNRAIPHYRKCYKHYKKLVKNTTNKHDIVKYGTKEMNTKKHLRTLENYNNIHHNKAYVPSIEKHI